MECLAFPSLINSRGRIITRASEIPDVPQQVPGGVLHTQASEMNANPEKGDHDLLRGPALNWQSPDQHKSATIEHLIQDLAQARAQCRKTEVCAADGR